MPVTARPTTSCRCPLRPTMHAGEALHLLLVHGASPWVIAPRPMGIPEEGPSHPSRDEVKKRSGEVAWCRGSGEVGDVLWRAGNLLKSYYLQQVRVRSCSTHPFPAPDPSVTLGSTELLRCTCWQLCQVVLPRAGVGGGT